MAAHLIETVPRPAENAPSAEWERYVAGITPPDSDAPDEAWDAYYQLTDEVADASPDATFQGRVPKAHADLMGKS